VFISHVMDSKNVSQTEANYYIHTDTVL